MRENSTLEVRKYNKGDHVVYIGDNENRHLGLIKGNYYIILFIHNTGNVMMNNDLGGIAWNVDPLLFVSVSEYRMNTINYLLDL